MNAVMDIPSVTPAIIAAALGDVKKAGARGVS
jgi:hypothetical protein